VAGREWGWVHVRGRDGVEEGWQVDKRWVVAKDYLKHKIIRTIMILILSRKDYTFPYQG